MKRTVFILIVLTLLSGILATFTPVKGASSLHKLDLAELSNNAVICMHQDPQGYLWIGTYDGLNLYNGKDIYVYRFELNYKNSLCSNIIQRITDAEPGYLWISTSLGFNKFSLEERRVIAAYPGYIDCIHMACNREGIMMAICREDQITCYSPRSQRLTDLPLYGINPQQVVALLDNGDGSFDLLLTSGERLRLTLHDDGTHCTIQRETQALHAQGLLAANREGETLFFVDESEQLYQCTPEGKEKTWIANLKGMREKYGEIVRISSFQSTLLVAFRWGKIVDVKQPAEPLDVGLGIFWSMVDQQQDIYWIGTDGQGIQTLYDKPARFGSILQSNLPIPLHNPIRSLLTDQEGTLWFGTKGDGIVRIENYERYANQPIPASAVTHYTTAEGLTHDRVYCFKESRFHPFIWIGTEDPGFCYFARKEQRITQPKQPTGSTPILNIHRIIELNDSTLWLSSTSNGLYEATFRIVGNQPEITALRTVTFKKGANPCNEIQDMVQLNDSIFLLGSRRGYGLISYNLNSEKYTFLQEINSEHLAIGDILSVRMVTDNTLLIGSSSGLLGASFRQNRLHIYPMEHNRREISIMIHGILQEGNGHVWLSTNKGLAKYNPVNQLISTYQTPALAMEEFSDDAYWACPYSGRLFFGGVNGLVWINPQTEEPHSHSARLALFEIRMDDKVIPLDKELPQRGITVPNDVQMLTLTMAVPDYIHREEGAFSFQLEGFDNFWYDRQRNNKIELSNLPSGHYLLHVRYRTDVSEASIQELILPIHALPPFYRSTLAIIGYVVISLLLFGLCFFLIRRRYHQKQTALAHQLREEQKEKLYKAKLNFFTHITHELCSPLTLINGVDNYIHRYANEQQHPKLQKYSAVLRDNVAELNELIQEILDFRKAEDEGFSKAQIQSVAITRLLSKQYQWFQSLAEQQQVQFTLNQPDALLWPTDTLYFKKIVTNLLSNAFKYTHQGGDVRVNVEIRDEQLWLSVYNTGQGIREADRKDLFHRYSIIGSLEGEHQTGTARHGLGLFICHSLVQALNGQIEVRSEEGKYAEFIVRLPKLAITQEASEAIQPAEEPESTTAIASDGTTQETLLPADHDHTKPLILVVDDHKDIVWLMTQSLSDEYQVMQAFTGEEALELIHQQTPNLIITDLMMPGINGLELIDQLKQDRFTKHIPVIIVSAKISEKEQAEGLQRGANSYLTKPFSPEVLHSVVDRLMQNQQEMKDYFYSPESAYQVNEGQLLHQEDKAFIESVNDLVKQHIKEEGFGPDWIANELHMSSRMFSRRFKRITGTTPSDFIKAYRFNYAAQLLVNTNLSVQEIIFEVGVSSKSYFYREFARKFNLTPSDYRLKATTDSSTA
ncbi:MAG: response regulator [Parabacteroides sp.]